MNHDKVLSDISCPVCGSTKYSLYEKWGNYNILVCIECKLSFSNPMRGGDSDFYKEHLVYKPIDKITIDQHRRSAARPANQHLLSMLSEGKRVLDVGCGYGAFVNFAVQQGFDAYGIDFNNEHIKAGQSMFGLGERLIVGDIKALQTKNDQGQKFDLVTLFEVIEHVENPKAIIQSVRSLLADGGLLALSCPNEARWQPVGRIFVDYPPHHLTRWRPDTMRMFLENQGFNHLKTELETSFSDFFWIVYVNYSASRKAAIINSSQNSNQSPMPISTRNVKIYLFNLIKLLSKPFDLFLKGAGVGTMGMRIIVRKD